MTMQQMNEYLEKRGFEVERVCRKDLGVYRFTIKKNGNLLTESFKYPETNDWNYRNERMLEFLNNIVDEFEERYPNNQWPKENPHISKGENNMNSIRWKVTSINIDGCSYASPEITVELNAMLDPDIDGRFGIEHINANDIAKELETKLNRSGDKVYNPMLRYRDKMHDPMFLRNGKTEYQYAYYRNILNSMYVANPYYRPEIENVIFNDPATIVFWTDGTKTVVKCQEDDEFDPEKGLTMAIAKKVYGNKGSYCNVIKKWCEPYHEKQKEKNDLVARICDVGKKAATTLDALDMVEATIVNAKEQEEKKHRNLYKYDDPKSAPVYFEKSDKNDRKYELIYETRADAEKVLNGMSEIINEYGFVTVADLYDISGLPGAYYTDSSIGWKGSIEEPTIKRVRDGYVIDLPKPEVLG